MSNDDSSTTRSRGGHDSKSSTIGKTAPIRTSGGSGSSGDDNDDGLLIFQDEMLKHEDDDRTGDPSTAFFELANAPVVAYRLPVPSSSSSSSPLGEEEDEEEEDDTHHPNRNEASCPPVVLVRVKQNSRALTHTGGVVWETSYLLLGYLLGEQQRRRRQQQQQQSSSPSTPRERIVEIGAGCGMLGISLAVTGCASEVILTEVDLVMPLLRENVRTNQSLLRDSSSSSSSHTTTIMRACQLDWTKFVHDAKRADIEPHSVDMIVGTDVVFAPHLVEPLWQTMEYLSHARTIIYLCVQIRCATSHEVLLDKAATYGFVMEQITNDNNNNNREKDEGDGKGDGVIQCLPNWALELECFLFRITRIPETKPKKKKRRKHP